MTHDNPDFQHNTYPASPKELSDIMNTVAQELDGALDFVAELGEDSLARQLDNEQMQGYPLGARFDHVSIEYGIGDDPVDPIAVMTTAVFVFQRFGDPESGSIGISETIALIERGDGYTRGFVLMDEGGSLPQKGTSDPITERAATQQSIDKMKEMIRNTDFTQLPPTPETDPGAVSRDNVANIADTLAIMHGVYAEMGLPSDEMDIFKSGERLYANWDRDTSSNPEFSEPADAEDGLSVRRVASHIMTVEHSTSHVFSTAALEAVGGRHPVIRAVMQDRGEGGIVITETRLFSAPETSDALPDILYTERTHTILPDGTSMGSIKVHYSDGKSQSLGPDTNPSLVGEYSGIHIMLRADLQIGR